MCRPSLVLSLLLAIACAVQAQSQSQSPAGTGQEQLSQEELTQQLNNPVGDLWLIVTELNISDVKNLPGDLHIYNYNLQPILPLHLSKNWNLINRPFVPFFFQSPTLGDKPLSLPLEVIDDSGLGDVGVVSLFSPAKPPKMGRGEFIWAVGPTFLFPTASKTTFGFEKWMSGPSGALAYIDRKKAFGVFLQQWWSFAGNQNRADKNFAWIQYFSAYQFAPGWQISGGSPIISVDWKNKDITFPVGVGMSYTAFLGPMPVEFAFEYQKTLVHPDRAPYQDNLFRMNITPVLPVLFGGKRPD